jgi:hypothetical protein
VNVIRHHDECVGFRRRESSRHLVPEGFDHEAPIVHLHQTGNDLPEQTPSILDTHGNEVRTRARVIESMQTHGPPIVWSSMHPCAGRTGAP